MEVSVSTVVAFFAALCIVFLLGKILGKPARWIGRLLLNGIIGGVVLYLVNLFGGLIGLHAAFEPFYGLDRRHPGYSRGCPGVGATLAVNIMKTFLQLPIRCGIVCGNNEGE